MRNSSGNDKPYLWVFFNKKLFSIKNIDEKLNSHAKMRHEGHNKSSEFLFQEKKYSSVLKPDNNSMILLYKSFK